MGRARDIPDFLSLCEQLNISLTIKPDLERRGYIITVKKNGLGWDIVFGREEIRQRFFKFRLINQIEMCVIEMNRRLEQEGKITASPKWKRFLKNRFERTEQR